MVRHEVDDDAHPRFVGAADEQLELVEAGGDVGSQLGRYIIIIAHGVGRPRLPLDIRVGGEAVGGEVGLGGVVEDAGVPDVGDAQRADGLQAAGREVLKLGAAVLGKASAADGGT